MAELCALVANYMAGKGAPRLTPFDFAPWLDTPDNQRERGQQAQEQQALQRQALIESRKAAATAAYEQFKKQRESESQQDQGQGIDDG